MRDEVSIVGKTQGTLGRGKSVDFILSMMRGLWRSFEHDVGAPRSVGAQERGLMPISRS